jgi:hypothetical protein
VSGEPPPDPQTPVAQAKADRDACVLALAILSLDRPGWHNYLRGVAREMFDGLLEFDEFRRLNEDRWQDRPLL